MATLTRRRGAAPEPAAQPEAADPAVVQFYATCPRGLADALAAELAALGAADVKAGDAGVDFTGPFELAYAANLESRLATRILARVSRFDYRNERDIYDGAKRVRWQAHFGVDRTFKVDTNGVKAPVKSLDFITLKVKDAIADAFREALGKRPDVSSRAPDVRVHVFLDARWCTLYLDTSGEPLFKRGRRDQVGEAPLKKNLAAGLLKLSGWMPDVPLLDPMCGAGTILIEAAEMALGRAPGRGRAFGFENLARFDRAAWEKVKALSAARELAVGPRAIHGSDLYGRTLDAARANLRDMDLEGVVSLKQVNLLELSAPAGAGLLVTNPPYGVRLGEKEELAKFYPELGHALKQRFAGWTAYILSGDTELPKLIRLSATKRTVLYNGAIECRLYEYRMVAGGNRP
ncbi:MAG: class I SAM-dependent RNA methyltransferase [Betaproteobacteria bacterium]|nr:class I SAM-dependent RNA methyltransferase [Betaproteobacteria bacterium]